MWETPPTRLGEWNGQGQAQGPFHKMIIQWSFIVHLGIRFGFAILLMMSIPLKVNASDADEVQLSKEEKAALVLTIDNLTLAIQKGDYRSLKSDTLPKKRIVSWKTCIGGLKKRLSFKTIVEKLHKASLEGKIEVNDTIYQPLFITMVETKGWGGSPIIYILSLLMWGATGNCLK